MVSAGFSTVMRIAIVDGDFLWREYLRTASSQGPGREVVGEAGDGIEAVRLILRTAPELVLLDPRLPRLGGFDLIETVQRSLSLAMAPRYVIISGEISEYLTWRSRQARAYGILDKPGCSPTVLHEAIARAGEGRVSYSPLAGQLHSAMAGSGLAFYKLLTETEIRILCLVTDRLNDSEISRRLAKSTESVKKHIANMFRKLEVHSRPDLERYGAWKGFSSFGTPRACEPEPRFATA